MTRSKPALWITERPVSAPIIKNQYLASPQKPIGPLRASEELLGAGISLLALSESAVTRYLGLALLFSAFHYPGGSGGSHQALADVAHRLASELIALTISTFDKWLIELYE